MKLESQTTGLHERESEEARRMSVKGVYHRQLMEQIGKYVCRDAIIMTQFQGDDNRGKISMKELFGRRNITKDGKEGKVRATPPSNLLSRLIVSI